MKKKFSTKWKSSKQPRKQRKYNYNMPLHLKQKEMSATLDKVLRKKYNRRSLELRKNDEVSVMRGKFKKKAGKIEEVNRTKLKVAIEGINITKKDGNKIKAWFHPSNLKIIKANEDDKKRFKIKNKENEDVQKNK
jgi:large subunit ribosomal protein L24